MLYKLYHNVGIKGKCLKLIQHAMVHWNEGNGTDW